MLQTFICVSLLEFYEVSEREGLTGSQFLEGGCWERRGDFFQGWSGSFNIKNKLKSEIFNDKKRL